MSFRDARACVLETVACANPPLERVSLQAAAERVLARDATADRDYPPLPRSARDGFALRADGFSGTAEVIGEVRAGAVFGGVVGAGQAVEIMTGAPVPEGADAVVMVEHVERDGSTIRTARTVAAGEAVNPRGGEAREGEVVLEGGRRLRFPEVALLASIGAAEVSVFAKPRAAIVSTGDEVVPVEASPEAHQIRNSNAWSLAAQVARAGGVPVVLPVARDAMEDTRGRVQEGLDSADLLLLSGGVSAGKYDVVERVLAEMGAEFFFDRVLIQPGQPLVFGRVRGRFFFGLPGNPASTMVTFELFARAALERLGGQREVLLPLLQTTLAAPFRHRPGLTRFLPARLSGDGASLTPLRWAGSGDMVSMSRANAWLVADADRPEYAAGDTIGVLVP
ncbi:MAG: molybdopterin molybdotransferase MoeA [Bryobacteraceae bacterium]|nr:molybdopterin molybdotransferase MoeA [Bryobacteraceae bacterium]